MPYIHKQFRESASKHPIGSGELNFKITTIILDYLDKSGHNYSVMNEIVGALENAKTEFYRRVVAPYEDGKIIENGDVYLVHVCKK